MLDLQDQLDMANLINMGDITAPKKFVLALSGGMDSATLYFMLLAAGHEVLPVIFSYGSKHNEFENDMAVRLCYAAEVRYPVNYHRPLSLHLSDVFSSIKSALLNSGGEIPEGHYEADSMKSTVVPGRNLIFAAVLASIAESREFDYIALGVHAGDHHIYPDCRPVFCRALMHTVKASSDGHVGVKTPLLRMDKTRILQAGKMDRVPYELTRTCYKAQPIACGKCGSCQERLEAFANNKTTDPVEYEER